jgi:hypothetical protein
MSVRTRIVVAALALGAIAIPLASDARVFVDIDVAPPAPRVEVVPAARAGWVWAPGYWNWQGRRHVWVTGHWIREHRGYRYVPQTWVQRDGRWHFETGGWVR